MPAARSAGISHLKSLIMRTNPIVLFLALALHASAEEIGKDTLAEEGKAAFASCMACHGLDGKGMAAGPKKLAPLSRLHRSSPVIPLSLRSSSRKASQRRAKTIWGL
ncbi:c-type cytochrome [Luteolibacter sp. Populi]|uniref:c-type cytochrome n=1 Tax=Luteolibacter sp. Populi TaxID=3230487 RepID=UPI003466AD60